MTKPSRALLLKGIGRLQDLVGKAKADYWNDRSPDRAELVIAALTEAFELCLALRSHDPPVDPPIPMLLPCLRCNHFHEDLNEWATKPHRTHRCAYCGYEWRPANVPTVGVLDLPQEPT